MHATLSSNQRRALDGRTHPIALYVAIAGKLLALGLWFTSHRTAAVWAFFTPDLWVLHALFVSSGQGLCRVYTRFATDRPEIWLTIDDGPDEHDTPRLLDLLDRHHARATFFVVGERAARLPHVVAEILRRGHEIGHHTHTHPAGTFWCASPARLAAELDRPLETLERQGARPQWFRAPVGIKHLLLGRALAHRGLGCVAWTIRSGDCLARSPEDVVRGITARLRPGAIVLLHEGVSVPRHVRVTAIARLLAELDRRQIACVIPRAGQLR